MENLPFDEKFLSKNVSIRHFDKNVKTDEMTWHRDHENRIIEPLDENDWMFQLDNELPISIDKKILIPKDVYHRGIKGTTDLIIKVTRLKDDN